MNFDIKNPENLKGVDLIWIFEVLETLLGTQNWGISNLCSSGYKLGNQTVPTSGARCQRKKEKKRKRKEKEKGRWRTDFGFSLNLTSGTRAQRLWLTWVAIKRKQEDCLNSAPKRRNDPSARSEADSGAPCQTRLLHWFARARKKREERGEGKETFSAQFLLDLARSSEDEDDGRVNLSYGELNWENFREVGPRQQVSIGQ